MDDAPGPHAIVAIDQHGTIIGWGGDATELLGHAPADAIGQDVTVLVPPDLRDAHRAGLAEAVAGGTRNVTGPFELPVLCASGDVRLHAARLTYVDDASGRMVGAIAVFTPQS